MAEMQSKLEALEKTNKEMQLKMANAGTGELGEELEAAARVGFIEKLTEVLAMRRGGKFDPNIFDEYNSCLVALGDKDLADIYQCFMLIYTGEEDDETLTKLGIELSDDEDVDEATVGFCEMMSIKIGELIDQPRHVRIAAHAAAKQKKADAEKARLEKIEKDKATHKAMAAMKTVTSRIYQANEPMWRLLANGEGDASEAADSLVSRS